MCDRPTPDSSRREGVLARPVRLSDGAEWGFMRPSVRLQPRVVSCRDALGRPVERISVEVGFGFPPEIESLIVAVKGACEGESVERQYEAFFALASALLRRAHEVSAADACELLSVTADELPGLVREVMSIVSETKDAQDLATRPPPGSTVGGTDA
jgi:hypothetical protein